MMELKEAIEKAGPDGEGKTSDGSWRFKTTHGELTFYFNGKQVDSLPIGLFDDDTWIVQDEVIEVGDYCKRTDVHGGCCKVGKIAGINHDEQAVIVYKDNMFSVAPIDKLTLIHKGPKVHTFKGVRWWRDEEGGAVYPDGRGDENNPVNVNIEKIVDISAHGKTYCIKVTEEVEKA